MGDEQKSNVVPFRRRGRAVAAPVIQRTAVDAARVLAELAALDLLGYQRARIRAAKELGCRSSFLDCHVKRIREEVLSFKRYTEGGNEYAGSIVDVNIGNGTVRKGLCLASGREWPDYHEVLLVLVDDGNFTVTRARPRG
jgi:hypothetical protein